MGLFIFVTREGHTFQPGSESADPDVENCQVIGFAEGSSMEEAFENLITENRFLLETTFDEIKCFELAASEGKYFHLKAH